MPTIIEACHAIPSSSSAGDNPGMNRLVIAVIISLGLSGCVTCQRIEPIGPIYCEGR